MRLKHIGIAVKSIEERLTAWRDAFGLKVVHIKEVPTHKIRVAMIDLAGVTIELLEPLGADSTVATFLETRGEGLHHVCLEVDNIERALSALKQKKIRLIDAVPRIGAEGKKIAFVHPKDIGGVLVELSE